MNPSSVVPAKAGTHPSASPNETIGIGVGKPTHTRGPTEPWVPACAGTTELRAETLAAAGGVRIAGVELSEPLSPELKDAIWRDFLAHHIVVFPGQFLTRGQQFAFAGNFGEVEVHGAHRGEAKRYDVAHVMSNLDADGNPVLRVSKAANYHWHTDKPYHSAPPMLTMLRAVEVPPTGGDTEFAEAESSALLGELLDHATQPQFVYRHCWRAGDLVMWDNRCLLHRLVADDSMRRYRRVMHRSVVRGTVPV